jgi:hypothetical protein
MANLIFIVDAARALQMLRTAAGRPPRRLTPSIPSASSPLVRRVAKRAQKALDTKPHGSRIAALRIYYGGLTRGWLEHSIWAV